MQTRKHTKREDGELEEHLRVTIEDNNKSQIQVDSFTQHPTERRQETEVDQDREEVANT